MRGKVHPTQKPSRLAEVMIETSSNHNDSVLDMFAGAGGAFASAIRMGRRAYAVEIDPFWRSRLEDRIDEIRLQRIFR